MFSTDREPTKSTVAHKSNNSDYSPHACLRFSLDVGQTSELEIKDLVEYNHQHCSSIPNSTAMILSSKRVVIRRNPKHASIQKELLVEVVPWRTGVQKSVLLKLHP